MEKCVEYGAIQLEELEIEIDIKIKIRKRSISFYDIEDIVIPDEILEGIAEKFLFEKYDKLALPPGDYESYKKDLIDIIRKHIENAIFHIEKANKIVKQLSINKS